MRNTTRSACWGPTSCSPTGSPALFSPAHTVAAGERVMLKGYVNWTQLGVSTPFTVPWPSPTRGATPAQVGVTKMRASWNSSMRVRFMRWKRSKTRTSSSAVVDWAASTMARSTGSISSHLGCPMKGRMVRSWHTPMTVRKSATGSVSKTVSTSMTSAPSDSSTSTARRQMASTSASTSA